MEPKETETSSQQLVGVDEFGFGPPMRSVDRWKTTKQLIPIPDIFGTESSIQSAERRCGISMEMVNRILESIPEGYAYLDWIKIPVGLVSPCLARPSGGNRFRCFQFPVVAFCTGDGKSETWAPIPKDQQQHLNRFLLSVGFKYQHTDLMGKKGQKCLFQIYSLARDLNNMETLRGAFSHYRATLLSSRVTPSF